MTRTPPTAPVPPRGNDADARASARTASGDPTSPTEIAREAFRQLALRRIAPTPDNYRDLYAQIAGVAAEDAFPTRALKAIAATLPRATPEALRLARLFEKGVADGNWNALRQSVLAICETRDVGQKQWGTLIRDLLAQFERVHADLTQARKREALNHVLTATSDPDQLFLRLGALARGWAQHQGDGSQISPRNGEGQAEVAHAAAEGAIAPLLSRLLLRGVLPLAEGDEVLAAEARTLSLEISASPGPEQLAAITTRMDQLIARLDWAGEEQRAIRQALLNLLRLIVDNIRELVIDDNWLHGQMSVISEAFGSALDIRVLDEVERRLREVIDKQSHLKRQLTDAQQRLKSMLAGFIDRLSDFSVSTGDYQEVLARGAERIGKASDISELSDVVEEILRETHNTRESVKRSGEELSQLREQVDSANQHIVRLQRELDETSELVRHDPLTGALNRKGLDEALAREIARMRRLGTALCVALLDIDNFKQINDAHGHLVGDEALRHLSGIVRDTLRPQDAVARYGGEEFLILLPDTDLDQANAILVRLQRELTRRFFLANTQHLLITFSAGIARLEIDEEPRTAIDRADKAMYAAKRAGKNRVLNAV